MIQQNKTILDEQQQREYQSVSSDDRQKLAPELRPQAQSGITTSIGWILQIGVSLSAVIILLGIILLPTRSGGLSPERMLAFPDTLGQVVAGLFVLRPQAIITLGLLLLIATPIVRVAASIVAFAFERDRRYVIITSIVLIILLLSLFLGGTGPKSGPATDASHLHFSLSVVLLIFGAAAAYVRDRLTNLRVGMFLELATTVGAISGAFLAGLLAPGLLGVIFGVILLVSAAPLVFKIGEELPQGVKNDRWANALGLASSYPDHKLGREVPYQVTHTPLGLAMMYVAGLISGLLGIGSGTFKVVAMDTVMRLPLKVSTTTSNLMIGVTAAASAGIYFSRGDIPPLIAAPVALGVLLGALIGARLLLHLSNKILRLIFLPVIVIAALEMILHGLGIGSF